MTFDREDLTPEPMALFVQWFEQACAIPGVHFPTAMTLSTVAADGVPNSRVVLLKDATGGRFRFYTNSHSTKGKELAHHAVAALNFYWDQLRRQVRVQGTVSQVSEQEADEYFASRPRLSQIGAWASLQSTPVESRAALDQRVEQLTLDFAGKTVTRPPHWTGFTVAPSRVEFWQEREGRLHDRFVYQLLSNGDWHVTRLYP